MKTIWKFPLSIQDAQSILVPSGGEILSVQIQDSQVCLWIAVNPANPKEQHTIEIFGTGHGMDESEREYIGTVQDGRLVWHIFEQL